MGKVSFNYILNCYKFNGEINMQDIPKKSGIYQIRNLVNGKVYVGSAVDLKHRWQLHIQQLRENRHHSIKLQRAFNKYGEDNFIFEVIELIEDKSTLLQREQFFMNKFNVVNEGYNICPIAGSSLGVKRSEECKRKIGAIHKGKIMSKEFREQVRQRFKGIPLSEKHKQHIKEAKQFIKESTREKLRNSSICKAVVCLETGEVYRSVEEVSRVFNVSGGRLHACLHKKDKSAIGLHWVFKQEYDRMSEDDTQQILSQPARQAKKKVKCVETGEIFESATVAAKHVHRSQSCITECCLGNQHTCADLHWEYVKD